MSFNPLTERGIPLDRQLRNWSGLNVKPYNKQGLDPFTRMRILVMNSIEVDAAMFSHQFARSMDHPGIKRMLAMIRRVEQQQQKAVNWLIPGEESSLETAIAYEQAAVNLAAHFSRNEPDPYIRQTLNFGLLEDFDHLYRFAHLLELLQGQRAAEFTGPGTDLRPGRPTALEHRHPYDDIRRHYDKHTVDPRSRLHAMTITAIKQQTLNFYSNVGNRYRDPIARGLYLEIGMIEEQHLSQCESLLDPLESWFEQEVFHHYNECYLYYSFMMQETDRRIKLLWELHLAMEIEHLRIAGEMLRYYDGIEPAEILPAALPAPTRMEPNTEYVLQALAEQVNLRALGMDFVPLQQLSQDARYFEYQQAVHGDVTIPSEQVSKRQFPRKEPPQETVGPHPTKKLRRVA